MYSGKFYGLATRYDETCQKKIDSLKILITQPEALPGIHDTVQICLTKEKNVGKLVIFNGFREKELCCRYLSSDEMMHLELPLIDDISIGRGSIMIRKR